MSFYLSQRGRLPVPLDGDKASCRAQVREIARGELKRARARYGRAFLHKFNDSYTITLGADPRSALWTSIALVGTDFPPRTSNT